MSANKPAISVTLDKDVEFKIRELAEVHRRSLSSMINEILAERLGLIKINNSAKDEDE